MRATGLTHHTATALEAGAPAQENAMRYLAAAIVGALALVGGLYASLVWKLKTAWK